MSPRPVYACQIRTPDEWRVQTDVELLAERVTRIRPLRKLFDSNWPKWRRTTSSHHTWICRKDAKSTQTSDHWSNCSSCSRTLPAFRHTSVKTIASQPRTKARSSPTTWNYSTMHVCVVVHKNSRLWKPSLCGALSENTKIYHFKVFHRSSAMKLKDSTAHACTTARDHVDLSERRKRKIPWNDLKLSILLAFGRMFAMKPNYYFAHACANVGDDSKLLTKFPTVCDGSSLLYCSCMSERPR